MPSATVRGSKCLARYWSTFRPCCFGKRHYRRESRKKAGRDIRTKGARVQRLALRIAQRTNPATLAESGVVSEFAPTIAARQKEYAPAVAVAGTWKHWRSTQRALRGWPRHRKRTADIDVQSNP